MTGLELKVRRIRRRIKASDLAVEMGVSPGRVSQIEALAHVPPHTLARYIEALARLTPDTFYGGDAA